jgi:hypothetical protein
MADFPTRAVPARDGSMIYIPTLEARDGFSVGMYNFAGPGWNSSEGSMAARPVETFDFAAKIHDLHYCISDIEFKTKGGHDADVQAGRGNAVHRSHQHKADRIFRMMVEHTRNWGLGPYYSRTRFIHERTEWALPNDGFVNLLTEPMLVEVLREYRMVPWSALGRGSRSYRTDVLPAGPAPVPVLRPNYAAPVPEDAQWYEWAREFYAPVWQRLLEIV